MFAIDPERKPAVLVADDDRLVRLLMKARLNQLDFDVMEAEDGLQAISLFKSSGADIAILDVMMPNLNGFEACRVLRHMRGPDELPILMVTGLDDIESIKLAYDAGATDFVMKPINWLVLGERVRYMWRSSLASRKNLALLNAIPDMVLQIGADGTILGFKGSRKLHPDEPLESPLGKRLEETFLRDLAKPMRLQIERALETGEMQVGELPPGPSGESRSYESRIVTVAKDETLALVRDITERKKAEEQVAHLAYHDPLTGLLNRFAFKQHLAQMIAQSRRNNRFCAVLFLNMDRFKRINDSFGHDLGDLLLKAVADRISNCVRASDLAGRMSKGEETDHMARLEGDEFAVLLGAVNTIEAAGKVARRLLESVSLPFHIAGNEIFVTTSLGISLYPVDGTDPDTLLKNADAAMYFAKEQGRNNFQYYTRAMNAAAFERLSLENDLRRALQRGEFVLYYQPQVSAGSGRITGVESLIRWQHPELGTVPPDSFISLAEDTGLINPIGEWVIHAACEQERLWREGGLAPVRFAVNVSSIQFRQRNIVDIIVEAVQKNRLDPNLLEIELTESSVMQNIEYSILTLKKLRDIGIQVAIDDFGIGYSSLNYLRRFPLETLKIDRAFVEEIGSAKKDAAIVGVIIAMAHNLNLRVVAEGVETEQQLAFLRERGCDEIQGYFYSPPVAAEAMTSMLQSDEPLGPRRGGME